MPINSASRSIHVPDELATTHDVQFLVHTRMAVPDIQQLHSHIAAHLQFLKSLRGKGILGVAGPLFSPTGENTGSGLYVLRVNSLDEARRIAAQDPLHEAGVRTPTVEPWLQAID